MYFPEKFRPIALNLLQLDEDYFGELKQRRKVAKHFCRYLTMNVLKKRPDLVRKYTRQYGLPYTRHHKSEDYTDQLPEKLINDKVFLDDKIQALYNCGAVLLSDEYKKQRVLDLKGTIHCKNRYCPLCQKHTQLSRLVRFMPHLQQCAEQHDLHLLTLTVPNCTAEELPPKIDWLLKCYARLNYYLTRFGDQKSKHFMPEYFGGVRALEITFDRNKRNKGTEFHPHIHALVAFEQNFTMQKLHTNHYSFSKDREPRLFSDVELFIQRLWFLIVNGEKVNKTNLEVPKLSDPADIKHYAYSCSLDKIEDGQYFEVFKYAAKAYNEHGDIIDLFQFNTINNALKKRRTLQGYGFFHGIEIDNSATDEKVAVYEEVRRHLQMVEQPTSISKRLDVVHKEQCQDVPEYKIISGRLIHKMDNDELMGVKSTLTSANYEEALQKIRERRQVNKIRKSQKEKLNIMQSYARTRDYLKQVRASGDPALVKERNRKNAGYNETFNTDNMIILPKRKPPPRQMTILQPRNAALDDDVF